MLCPASARLYGHVPSSAPDEREVVKPPCFFNHKILLSQPQLTRGRSTPKPSRFLVWPAPSCDTWHTCIHTHTCTTNWICWKKLFCEFEPRNTKARSSLAMETEAKISCTAISRWSYAEGTGFLLLKTNYNKLSGLKQHKCILTVWRLEVPNGFRLKPRCLPNLFPLEAPGDNLFPCLFQILELHPWDFLPHCPFLIFEASTLLLLFKKTRA